MWALTGGNHDTTALCVRDSEFVRMSRVIIHLLRLVSLYSRKRACQSVLLPDGPHPPTAGALRSEACGSCQLAWVQACSPAVIRACLGRRHHHARALAMVHAAKCSLTQRPAASLAGRI